MKKILRILIGILMGASLIIPSLGVGDLINIADISVPYLSPGETGILKITVANVGENPLKSVRASLEQVGDSGYYRRSYQEENPIVPVGSPQYYLGYILANDSRDAYFNIAAQPGISPGTYLMNVVLEYTYGDTTSIVRKPIGITVGLTPRSVLGLFVSFDPQNPAPGQIVNLTLSISNRKSYNIKDIMITISPKQPKQKSLFSSQEEEENIIIPLGISTKSLGNLRPGENVQVDYQLAVSSKAEYGPYLVKFIINYLDQGNMEQNINQEFGLFVAPKPRLDIYPGEAKTGSPETKTKIKVTNSGPGEARDVRLNIKENDYFYGKREIFVAVMLGQDDTVDVEAEFFSKVKKEGIYPILIGLSYQEPSGKIMDLQLTQQIYIDESGGILSSLILIGIFGTIFYFINRKYKFFRNRKIKDR